MFIRIGYGLVSQEAIQTPQLDSFRMISPRFKKFSTWKRPNSVVSEAFNFDPSHHIVFCAGPRPGMLGMTSWESLSDAPLTSLVWRLGRRQASDLNPVSPKAHQIMVLLEDHWVSKLLDPPRNQAGMFSTCFATRRTARSLCGNVILWR